MECQHHEWVDNQCKQISCLAKQIQSKVSFMSLVYVVSIAVMVIGIFIGILHVGYQNTIQALQHADASVTKGFTEQSKQMNETLTAIKIQMAVMSVDIEHIKNGKK